jgi:hypothetical protein
MMGRAAAVTLAVSAMLLLPACSGKPACWHLCKAHARPKEGGLLCNSRLISHPDVPVPAPDHQRPRVPLVQTLIVLEPCSRR